MWQILPYLIKALFGHFMQYFLYNKNLRRFKFKFWKVSKSEISNDSNSDKESDETKNRKSLKKILFTANVFLHLSLSLIKKNRRNYLFLPLKEILNLRYFSERHSLKGFQKAQNPIKKTWVSVSASRKSLRTRVSMSTKVCCKG